MDILILIALFLIILYFGGFFNSYEKNFVQRKKVSRYYYNHCWQCKSPISHLRNRVCVKCKYFFICNDCGKCYCDSPFYNKN